LTAAFLPIAAVRVVDGVGKGMKDAPRDALLADDALPNTRGRVFGFSRMVDTAGSVVGPLVAFVILASLAPTISAYRLIFALTVIPGAIALALIWFGVRERSPEKRRVAEKGAMPREFWVFSIGMTIALLTKVNDSLFLVRAQDLGISKTLIPLLFGGFTLLYAVFSYPIGIWSDRIGKMPLLIAGWILLAAVELGFSFHPSLILTLVLFAGYGMFFALTEGSARAFIADAVEQTKRGRAYGIYYTLTGVGLILGGYFLGRIWDLGSPQLAFQLSAVGSMLGAFVLWVLHRRIPAVSVR
jgi:MFS family permease